MKWNIFKRVAALEVRVLVAESNHNEVMTRLRALEPKLLSETDVKKRLKIAAYGREYYKKKKSAAAMKSYLAEVEERLKEKL